MPVLGSLATYPPVRSGRVNGRDAHAHPTTHTPPPIYQTGGSGVERAKLAEPSDSESVKVVRVRSGLAPVPCPDLFRHRALPRSRLLRQPRSRGTPGCTSRSRFDRMMYCALDDLSPGRTDGAVIRLVVYGSIP